MAHIISIGRLRPLYELALRIRELAPWQELGEEDVFAVRDPQTQHMGFVSVIGKREDFHAVFVYLDYLGLLGFLTIGSDFEYLTESDLYNIPHLELNFENKYLLDPEDHQILRELGIKLRSEEHWPSFCSCQLGLAPWQLDNEEIEFMKTVLEQAIVIFSDKERIKLLRNALEKNKLFCRQAKISNQGLHWEDHVLYKVTPPTHPVPNIDETLFNRVGNIPYKNEKVYFDFQHLSTPVRFPNQDRPYLPIVLVSMEKKSKKVLYSHRIITKDGWSRFVSDLPNYIFQAWLEGGYIPKRILIRSFLLVPLFQALRSVFNFKFRLEPEMDAVDEFIDKIEEQYE